MTDKISGSTKLNQLLGNMNRDGNFPLAILTDVQGLAIASAGRDGMDLDRQSAVVAFIQKTAVQVTKQLGMGMTDEISLYYETGKRLVCRPFRVNDHELILAVIVPEKNLTYRRATNHAINEIRQTWKHFWE